MPFTENQKRFMREIQRGAKGAEAARVAGYSVRSAKQIAYSLLHLKKYRHLQERLAELVQKERAAQDRAWKKWSPEGE